MYSQEERPHGLCDLFLALLANISQEFIKHHVQLCNDAISQGFERGENFQKFFGNSIKLDAKCQSDYCRGDTGTYQCKNQNAVAKLLANATETDSAFADVVLTSLLARGYRLAETVEPKRNAKEAGRRNDCRSKHLFHQICNDEKHHNLHNANAHQQIDELKPAPNSHAATDFGGVGLVGEKLGNLVHDVLHIMNSFLFGHWPIFCFRCSTPKTV